MAGASLGILCVAGLVLLAPAPAPAEAGYARFLPAKHGTCKHQNKTHARQGRLRSAMRCLVKEVRQRKGVHTVRGNRRLGKSAEAKASDIRRCGSLSHNACGRDAFYWQRHYGYTRARRWRAGENLAWGAARDRTPRKIMRAWLRSDPHRHLLFERAFRHMGVGLSRGGFQGRRHASIWVLHLGCHC